MVRYARGTRATELERAGQDCSMPPLPTFRGVSAVEPRPTAWEGARQRRALAHITTTPGPRCVALAPRSVGRFSMRYVRGVRVTGLERAHQDLLSSLPPTHSRRNTRRSVESDRYITILRRRRSAKWCRRRSQSACLRVGAARELAALVPVGSCLMKGHCAPEASLLRCETVVRRASCGLQFVQPAFAWHARARHCARFHSGGGAARELSACARRAGRVVVGPRSMIRHCTGRKPLSFVTRPLYDVPAVASTLRSRLSRDTRACATALAIAREEAQHASFPRARAVPGGLCSAHAL